MITRTPVGDKMIKTVVTEEPLQVDYDDIECCIEYDDWHCEAPWESCDGWDHEFHRDGYYTHEGLQESRGWVNRTTRNGGSGYIEIDDDDIVNKWGFTRRAGESKQVWLERVARVKRNALDQLVKWYTDGWSWYTACATYGDYSEAVGGIDCERYAEELAEELRREVAGQLEDDGYQVSGIPDPPKPHNHHKERIRRNLNCAA